MANEFYAHARAYDIAFSDRDFKRECDFLEWCLTKHGNINNADKSFIELAAGPGKHAREFASRGWYSAALDLSPEMVAYAAIEARKENLNIKTINEDMSKFVSRKKYALAGTLMESISHLTTNEQMISHFKSISKSLMPGGIYVIEATHPRYYFPDDEPNQWTSKEGNNKVEITFGTPSDSYDSITQTWDITTRMKMWENDSLILNTEEISRVRWYLFQEMQMLIELSGVFDKYWVYGSMFFLPPKEFDNTEDSDAMVLVMRTKQ
ncbi:MAG: hypothetical protein CVV23_10225 [Ignavibacteriae bacterium HGW-Ignavibacteriae-2]|jgi:SAM-dependent methyltransferase|nr:MAG: hypothetical protein CVV23_10225 [Ignavibacteriae bacterium HGW-Ignavibacteriae-2]